MIFKAWRKNRIPRKPFTITSPPKDRSVLSGIDPRLKQIALNRLAILRTYHIRLSKPGRLKTKREVLERFLTDLNSGILWPNGVTKPIPHVGRSTVYVWDRAYRNGRLAALVPHYGVKLSTGKATYRPLVKNIEMKFSGRPRARGKRDFVARVKRRWKGPPLECPIRLSIFYYMPIPKGTRMRKRMGMLKHRISHRGKPNIDALNAFVVDSMMGIVFREHGQIVQFHSEKKFGWWPEVRILLKALPG
jgi:Holliday junction resolvase RusA-like endonuclease